MAANGRQTLNRRERQLSDQEAAACQKITRMTVPGRYETDGCPLCGSMAPAGATAYAASMGSLTASPSRARTRFHCIAVQRPLRRRAALHRTPKQASASEPDLRARRPPASVRASPPLSTRRSISGRRHGPRRCARLRVALRIVALHRAAVRLRRAPPASSRCAGRSIRAIPPPGWIRADSACGSNRRAARCSIRRQPCAP